MIKLDDKFDLTSYTYYKKYVAQYPRYIRNTKTGEDMGQVVKLRIIYTDPEGNPLENPIKEEDCYEFARYENN